MKKIIKDMTKGERLEAFRKRRGLTQAEFAEIIDTSQPHLSAMENGTRQISAAVLINVADNFEKKLNLDWLHHGRGEMMYSQRPTKTSTPNAENTHLIGNYVVKVEDKNYKIVSKNDDFIVLQRVE